MPARQALLHLLRHISRHLDGDVSLRRLAARAGWSPFHLHRAFRRLTGETPKQYTQRLRLERAAARLAAGDEHVLRVALAEGFASHEVFTRAFRRHFGRTPAAYRAAALAGAPPAVRARHREVIDAAGPCIALYHLSTTDLSRRPTMPTESITRQELTPQPVLFVRVRAARHELVSAIGQGVGLTFTHAQRAGLALAGKPFTRYLATGPGLLTIEVGLPLAAPGSGAGEVEAGTLPGGPAVVAVHVGPYEQLGETYSAIERWIEEHGLTPAAAPWESYVTDPAEHPYPADWRTTVYWPLAGQ